MSAGPEKYYLIYSYEKHAYQDMPADEFIKFEKLISCRHNIHEEDYPKKHITEVRINTDIGFINLEGQPGCLANCYYLSEYARYNIKGEPTPQVIFEQLVWPQLKHFHKEKYLSLQECIEKLDVLKRIPAPVELGYLDQICILGWLKELKEHRDLCWLNALKDDPNGDVKEAVEDQQDTEYDEDYL
jgi:hypothetical protein